MLKIRKCAGSKPALLAVLLCLTVSLFSTDLVPGSHALTPSAEGAAMGGSDCSDFMNGAAVGLGIGVIFGCLWCGAAAIVAKGIGAFC